jgi:hypothetical protein
LAFRNLDDTLVLPPFLSAAFWGNRLVDHDGRVLMTRFKKLLVAVALIGVSTAGTAALAHSMDTSSAVKCAADSSL